MKDFEVEYSYVIPEYHVTTVRANHIDEVEELVLDELSATLPEEISRVDITIETIREIIPEEVKN